MREEYDGVASGKMYWANQQRFLSAESSGTAGHFHERLQGGEGQISDAAPSIMS